MKYCNSCGKLLVKKYGESQNDWNKRKFCNRKCAGKGLSKNNLFKEKCKERMTGNKINNGRKHINRKSPPPRPLEVREKISLSTRGEKGNNWQGGITPINASIRNSSKYKIWRKCVFEKYHYTCQECGQVGGDLVADHIKPFSLFPELRFVVSNGRTICKKCDLKSDTYGGRVYNYVKLFEEVLNK